MDASTHGLTASLHRSIGEIARAEWDGCFEGEPEGWAYYHAVERAGLAGFEWAYFTVREAGRVVAVAPAFVTAYRLDTTIQGQWRSALEPVLRPLRDLLTLQLACLGSPAADKCHLGFAPQLDAGRRGAATAALLDCLDAFAVGQRIGLVAAKDLADADMGNGVGDAFDAAGFARQPSLPNTYLSLAPEGGQAGEDAYLASLSSGTRRDLRRKLRDSDRLRIEMRRGADALDCVPSMMRLYDQQRASSGVDFEQFESLTPAYFQNVLGAEGMAVIVFLYWHGETLAAFNLCYHSQTRFIDKFIGFEPGLARSLNLYAVSWMANVRYCLANGIATLQAGQTGYAMKLRMGCTLAAQAIVFRHRHPVLNRLLRLAGPLLAADRHDQDLARAATAPRAGEKQ
ncbi:MAG: GNAT family N-acetyltransferase [Betaproteobacteria bacterium]